MEFPVDVLEATSYQELERSAHTYMNELLYSDPDQPRHLTLSSGRKVQISLSSVGFVPLYGTNVQHKVLALFTPQDQFTAVALFLANQWYAVEDILQTARPTREGLVKVRSVGERIVLYVLNRIVYRTREAAKGEILFLCHGENDYAKILWKDGEAVGFYSVKCPGSICNSFLRQCYFLPVMDSIFVRKAHRGKNHGLQMLEDFVDSFEENTLGLKYPLTPAMASVCRRYLDRYPADVDLLWEVEGVGGPYQRTHIASKLASWPVNADIYKGGHGEDNNQNEELEEEMGTEEDALLDIANEVLVVNKCLKVAEEISAPVSARTRSSEHRLRKRTREEVEENGVQSRPEKISRVEMVEDESVPSDGTGDDSAAPEAAELNGKQTEGQEEEKAGAEEEAESFVNGTGRKEVEVEKVYVPCYSTVAEDNDDVVNMDDENQQEETAFVIELEEDAMAEEQQEEESLPEEEEIGEKEHDDEVTPVEKQEEAPLAVEGKGVAPSAEMEKQAVLGAQEQKEAAPAAMEMEAAPAVEEKDTSSTAEEEAAPAVEQKEAAPAGEENEAAPTVMQKEPAPTGEEMEAIPAAEKKMEAVVAAEEKKAAPAAEESALTAEKEAAPAAEREKEAAPVAMEREEAALVEEEDEAAPAAQRGMEAAPPPEEKQVVQVAEQQHAVASSAEKEMGFAPFNEEEMEAPPDADKGSDVPPAIEEETEVVSAVEEMFEGEQGPDQDMDAVNDVEKDPDIPSLEDANASDVPPTPKCAFRRLGKVDLLPEEVEEGQKEATLKDVKGAGGAEEKVTTEEEEHSSVEEEQEDCPPVINRRVSRRNTKVSQARPRSRAKRRGKI